MADRWFVYRDVKGFPRQKIDPMDAPKPGDQVIRDQIFPAGADFPAMHIKHHTFALNGDTLHLISYTEAPLSRREAVAILDRVINPDEQTTPAA